ncbi:MAG: hypothetical protein J7K46_02785 [Bacteroidales bacterium]|nr:hypothetical protein [Bacteroidales bacterium]
MAKKGAEASTGGVTFGRGLSDSMPARLTPDRRACPGVVHLEDKDNLKQA